MCTSSDMALRPVARPIDQAVSLPGSKSLTNRVLVVAALADGVSHIEKLLLADDTRHMLDALGSLGVGIQLDEAGRRVTISGCAGHWPSGEADIFCGNAGTVMRFLTAACCSGCGAYRLDGVARMRERPIAPLVDALRELGAAVGYAEREGYCPVTIRSQGRLRGGRVLFDTPPSSQFISALLITAPLAMGDVMIEIGGEMPSKPYVAMTLGVMDAFGVAVVEDRMRRFVVPAPQRYSAADFQVEPDASAASYFFAAAAITGGRVTVEGLGSGSCQGDMVFVDVLERMGCTIDRGATETTVRGPADGRLTGIDVDLNDAPDVAQTLAVLAAFAEGPTRIRNVSNLRLKETDRLFALSTELDRMNVPTEVHEDGLSILPSGPPTASAVNTYDDHRMAMSFAVAGLRLDGMVIRNADCVSKTFPGFFDLWARLAEA
jgi:3-phosphoshikimate 1-carboxyvinyltransferase